MKSGNVLLGVLAGAAAGLALGILFAPDKGSVTRRKISKKGEEYADDLGEKYNELVNRIKKGLEIEKDELTQLAENGKSRAQELAADTSKILSS